MSLIEILFLSIALGIDCCVVSFSQGLIFTANRRKNSFLLALTMGAFQGICLLYTSMSKIRVSGEGDAGSNGGPAGDLFVVLHVKASDYFKRDGLDVYTRIDINPAQAVLGDEVEIETLDGVKSIKIQPGVQSGNTVKIKGAGVPVISRPSQRGDHAVSYTHLDVYKRQILTQRMTCNIIRVYIKF